MNNQPPTPEEWARAQVKVGKHGEPMILCLQKDVVKDGVQYTQKIWLTPSQLRGMAIEETF